MKYFFKNIVIIVYLFTLVFGIDLYTVENQASISFPLEEVVVSPSK